MKLAFIIVPIISIILGVGTGFVLAQATPTKTSSSLSETKENSVAEHTEQVQQKDAASFRDKAEGVIEKNDASDGENFASGTHKLIRGDESQTAYLISTNMLVKKLQSMGKLSPRVRLDGLWMSAELRLRSKSFISRVESFQYIW